jgi:signal transduction histidine kinase
MTARLKLTILFAALFFATGTVVLAITYVIVSRSHANAVAIQAVPTSGGNVLVRPGAPAPGQLLRSVIVGQRSSDLSHFLAASWVVLAISTILGAILGWFVAGRVLRPLRAITDRARTISAGNLHERLALTGPNDEFRRLGDTLDGLLGRLQASFEAQRRFVANAAHELRTPLTVERTLLQVSLADPDATAKQLRATCEELLANGAEQEQLLDALLTLASSERGLEQPQLVDLAAIAEHVLAIARTELTQLSLSIDSELDPAPTTGDPALLERLIANLIDNAVEYNISGGDVRVRTGTENGRAVLTVTNDGPQIAPEDIGRLLEPFQRLGAARTSSSSDHHGLGLSIVRAIAVAHGAELTLTPEPQGGLKATVSFVTL